MLNFVKWCESKKLGLPTTAENVMRSGFKGIYPAAYAGRGYAYPDQYWTPFSATAVLDLKNAKQKGFRNKDMKGLPPK
jgi:hypothetical protein